MSKPKVLLITSIFRWYAKNYKDALIENGCEVYHLNKSIIIPWFDVVGRIKRRFHLDYSKNLDRERKRINKLVIKTFERFKPDIVLLTLGNQLTRETLLYIKKTAIVANVFGDTFEQYPYVKEIADLFDIIYSYEMQDIDYLTERGIRCKPLMGLGNPNQYFPISCKKNIDICFVGAMYDNRKVVLEKLSEDFSSYNLAFYGRYIGPSHFFKFIKFKLSKKSKFFRNRDINFSKVNALYNKSKICLNLNGYQTKNGWSSRLIEIGLTNSFQITDKNESISNNFSGCLDLFSSYDELKKKILWALSHYEECNLKANKMYRESLSNHTYTIAMKGVVNDLKCLYKNKFKKGFIENEE